VVFYLCAFSNNLVFPDAELMCQRMLKHLICLILFLILKFSCSMSCTVVVYTPKGFMLAYFVAKKGEKNGIIISIFVCIYFVAIWMCVVLHLFLYVYIFCCCIYFATISGYV